MRLNPGKCQVLSFYKSKRVNSDYKIGNRVLDIVLTKKDLGETFDRQLSFKHHIDDIVSASSRALGYLLRLSRNISSLKIMRVLFDSIVRSKLEYACVIWSPDIDKLNIALEKCQRKFLKYLVFRKTGSYPLRGTDNEYLQRKFNVHSLQDRIKLQQIIYLLKIIRGLVDSPYLLQQISLSVPTLLSQTDFCANLIYIR